MRKIHAGSIALPYVVLICVDGWYDSLVDGKKACPPLSSSGEIEIPSLAALAPRKRLV